MALTSPSALNILLKAKNLDLSNLKIVLKDLKIQSPLLAEELLAGRVSNVIAAINGLASSPQITADLMPEDVIFEPLGAERPIHIKGGLVGYRNDCLSVKHVQVETPRGSLNVSMILDKLSTNSELSNFSMQSNGLDIGDLNAYIIAPRTPQAVRTLYLAALHATDIANPKGMISGHLDYRLDAKEHLPVLTGLIHVKNLSLVSNGFEAHDISGDLNASNNDLSIAALRGAVGLSRFAAIGTVNSFLNSHSRIWHLKLFSRLSMQELATIAGDKNALLNASKNQPVKVAAQVNGPEDQVSVKFSAQLDPQTAIRFSTLLGAIAKPKGEPGRLDGCLLVQKEKLSLVDTHVKLGELSLSLSGTLDNYSSTKTETAVVSLRMRADDLVPLETLVALMPDLVKSSRLRGLKGMIKGGIRAQGPLGHLKVKGGAHFDDVCLPSLNICQVKGSVKADEWISLTDLNTNAASIPVSFDISRLKFHKLLVEDLSGKFISRNNATWHYNVIAKAAQGEISLDGECDLQNLKCHIKLRDLDTNNLLQSALDAANEVTGKMNGEANITSSNIVQDWEKWRESLSGAGNIQINEGRVARFSLLEKRINQANLLKSGFLGFNLNNLLASVAPVEKGEFKTLKTKFQIHSGNFIVDEFTFFGDELRLRGNGAIKLLDSELQFEVAGKIPRTSSEGPLGSVAPLLGVGVLADTIEDLPELFSGKKSSQSKAARVFAFSMQGPLNKPDTVTQSIYKSFHWLPSSPRASAHPVIASPNKPSAGVKP
jgi:hypothetical protein